MKRIDSIVVIILFTIFFNYSYAQKCSITLRDQYNTKVEFSLESDTIKLPSNSDAILEVDSNQVNLYRNKKFDLHFENELAYLLYYKILYEKKNDKNATQYYSGEIRLIDLCKERLNKFYVREKVLHIINWEDDSDE